MLTEDPPNYQRLVDQLVDRLNTLHTLPTLADPNAIVLALKSLPSSLPQNGAGVDKTVEYLEKFILPSLAPGHAGPRFETLDLQ